MAARPTLENQRTDLRSSIKKAAFDQVAAGGISSLSLRAIARKLGISAPAIYNYFADRDSLIAEMINEAFSSFGAALEEARDGRPKRDFAGRFRTIGVMYRKWAIENPQRYALIFETTTAGYAELQGLSEAPIRSFKVLVGVLEDARTAGKLHAPDGHVRPTAALRRQLDKLASFCGSYSVEALYLGIEAWAKVHGIVSLELHGHLPGFLAESRDDFVRLSMDTYIRQLGLR